MAIKASESTQGKRLLFQKVGIFIDAENIELSGLKHHERRTDYKKILDQVGDRRSHTHSLLQTRVQGNIG